MDKIRKIIQEAINTIDVAGVGNFLGNFGFYQTHESPNGLYYAKSGTPRIEVDITPTTIFYREQGSFQKDFTVVKEFYSFIERRVGQSIDLKVASKLLEKYGFVYDKSRGSFRKGVLSITVRPSHISASKTVKGKLTAMELFNSLDKLEQYLKTL